MIWIFSEADETVLRDMVLHIFQLVLLHCLQHYKDSWSLLHLLYATFSFFEQSVRICSLYSFTQSRVCTHTMHTRCCFLSKRERERGA